MSSLVVVALSEKCQVPRIASPSGRHNRHGRMEDGAGR